MSEDNPDNPGYVSKDFCDERFGRIVEGNHRIESKIDDLKESAEKDRGRIETKVDNLVNSLNEETSTERSNWRNFLLQIGGGVILTFIGYVLKTLLG